MLRITSRTWLVWADHHRELLNHGFSAIPGVLSRDPWRSTVVLCRHLLSGPLPELVPSLLGTTPELFQDQLVSQTPGATDAAKWHQDYSYWPLDCPVGLTTWMASDEATSDDSCVQ
ncbi:MAG: hypothetical protein ACJAZO_002670 [Myxococcota bacterium]